MMTAVCYCDNCQAGARQIEALPDALPVLEPDGGTPYVLYRKDRYTVTQGEELLRDYKLKEESNTSRVVATCCNSAIFVRVDGMGHWISVYRERMLGEVPPIEMRVQTQFKPEGSTIPDDLPSYSGYPLRFIGKLLTSRIAMLFGKE